MLKRTLKFGRSKAHPRLGSLVRNAGIVFGGNATSAFIGLVYLAVLTRALSVEQFGLYSLFGAYVGLIGRLTSFQTWQGLIHYGAHARERDDKSLLFNLLGFGWLLDMASGLLGYVLALGGAVVIPGWFGLQQDALYGTAVAASVLIFNWISVPTALLRIYDRFMPQAMYQNISSLLQLVCVLGLWWLGETRLVVYLAVTAINNIIGQLWFFAFALREARKHGILDDRSFSLASLSDRCPGIWRFVFTTNADGMVRVLRDIDIFIVNHLLDATAAGLYKIARVLTKAMGKLTGPFYQTIYPELARMVAAGETTSMIKFMRQASLILGAVTFVAWLGFVMLGEPFLSLVFGPEYLGAYAAAAWCMAAMVVWGIAQPLSPVMMAIRKPGLAFLVHLATSLVYVALLGVLVWQFGLFGAGMALFLFYLLWAGSMFVVVSRQIKSRLIEA